MVNHIFGDTHEIVANGPYVSPSAKKPNSQMDPIYWYEEDNAKFDEKL